MAQLTVGIKLEWVADSAGTEPTSGWKAVPDITSIPTLIGEPSTHDVTTLSDIQKVYIEGLPDNGGTLGFSVNMTPEVLAAVEEIQTAQETANPWFRVALPKPLQKAYVFRGTVGTISNDELAPDNPIAGKLNITPSTPMTFKEYTPE